MPIAVQCQCGKQLRARDDSAGKKVKCPACGAGVLVPPSEGERVRGEGARKRVRVWMAPLTGIPSFVVLDDEELGFDHIVLESNARKARDRAEGGLKPSKVVGAAGGIIALANITAVRMDKKRRMVQVCSGQVLESDAPSFSFTEQKAADDFVAALHERLGPGWVRRAEQVSRLRASLQPLGGMLVCLFLLIPACASGDPFGSIGRISIIAIIGLFFLASLTWLIVYLIDPPLLVHLEPRG
jgi:DNA-directed RNA polymerase subunit RPC12/RpoP